DWRGTRPRPRPSARCLRGRHRPLSSAPTVFSPLGSSLFRPFEAQARCNAIRPFGSVARTSSGAARNIVATVLKSRALAAANNADLDARTPEIADFRADIVARDEV